MKILKNILCFTICLAFIVGTISFSPINSEAVERSGSTYHSKKGLQIEIGTMADVEELGASEAFFNIVLERLLSLDGTSVSCSSGGYTYYINEQELAILDSAVSDLTKMGATVIVSFANIYTPGYEWLLYTGAYNSKTNTYGYNIQTEKGRNAILAVAQFISSRYNGGQNGTITRYIIGNEVNDNEGYNWVGPMDIDSFVNTYYQTFKLFYQGIKAGKSDALVYVPLEHMWNIENSDKSYAGKDFLIKFNALAKTENVDWNLAYHAYSEPMCNPNPLRDGSPLESETGDMIPTGNVKFSEDTTVITMRNLEVLTDFMRKDEMKNNNGDVRSIILSEQGYTSNSIVNGEDETLQAAAVAYAYYTAEMNPYIDVFVLYAYLDPILDSAYDKLGIRGREGTTEVPLAEKKVYHVYKYIDTNESLAVTNFALSTLGIEDWSYVIKNFDASKFQGMKTIDNGAFKSVGSMSNAQGRIVLSETMASGDYYNNITNVYWQPGYYVFALSAADYQPDQKYHSGCVAVVDPGAHWVSAQTVYHDFSSPLNLESTPYLGFTIGFDPFDPGQYTNDKLNLRMRVYSGSHIYDVNTNIIAGNNAADNTSYTVFADLSGWAYKGSIDRVAIWISEAEKKSSYSGCFFVKDFSAATGLTSAQNMSIGKDTSKRIYTANPYTSQPWAYKWGNRDLSGEFNWEKYYNDNPDLQSKLGKSPVLLIEDYALKNIPTVEYVDMHRLYNPSTGEHFYTVDENEKNGLLNFGWKYEGVAWQAPIHSKKPVYRLYNYNSGEHHYTTDWNEAVFLYTTASGNNTNEDIKGVAWDYEGMGWFSDDLEFTPLYRLYNPNATGDKQPGSHHYTKDANEKDYLVSLGWSYEGIGWYGGK